MTVNTIAHERVAKLQAIIDEIYSLDRYENLRRQITSETQRFSIECSIGALSVYGFTSTGISITRSKSASLEDFGMWEERVLLPLSQSIENGNHQIMSKARNGKPSKIEVVGKQNELNAAIEVAHRYSQVTRTLLEYLTGKGE